MDFLRTLPRLTAAQSSTLLQHLLLAEVREAVAAMGDFKATGAFGVDIGALKVALAHEPTATLIT